MKKVAGTHGVRSSDFFHTNPYNFPEIQAAIKSYSYVSVSSKLAFWLIFSCFFHLRQSIFSHLIPIPYHNITSWFAIALAEIRTRWILREKADFKQSIG